MARRTSRRITATPGTSERWHCSILRRYQSFLHSLLLLHPPVLEPNFHLRLVQLQRRSDLYAPCPGQVLVEVKLLLQFRQLLVREIRSTGVIEATCNTCQRTAGEAVHRSARRAAVCRSIRSRPRCCCHQTLRSGSASLLQQISKLLCISVRVPHFYNYSVVYRSRYFLAILYVVFSVGERRQSFKGRQHSFPPRTTMTVRYRLRIMFRKSRKREMFAE